MTRKEKIELLKGISNGSKKVEELLESTIKLMIWRYWENEGNYTNDDTKEVIEGPDFSQKAIEAKYPSFRGRCLVIKEPSHNLVLYKIKMNEN
ncbi:MAG: hypothetical protein JWQ09_2981 [Segetibacter sp.]|nr:hypothetical protein [Segetibacter sp.]